MSFPYSPQYRIATREGHERPTPSFGAPTLVWHLGLWPGRGASVRSKPDPGDLKSFHEEVATEYETVRASFFDDLNGLLTRLQEVGSVKPLPFEQFDPRVLPQHWRVPPTKPSNWKFASHERDGKPFYTLRKESLWFTLWWRDDNSKTRPEPQSGDLRVETHVEAHRDYATITFYIDAGKIWDHPQPIRSGGQIDGRRRNKLFDSVEHIGSKCEPRLVVQADGTAAVDRELVPEHSVSAADAQSLMAASRYLYSELWDEFAAAFQIAAPEALVGRTGRVFANFRGLVIATAGIAVPSDLQSFPGSTGAKPFPRFRGNGGLNPTEDNEANAVIKAYWPFIRRISPFADEREFVACGVMNWRALYVTALGSAPRNAGVEENRSPAAEVPNDSLPEALIKRSGHYDKYDALSGEHGEEPVRYLFITKGEPHRRQIGRIVDRINTMGTMRLAALTDFTVLRDASTQLQLLGLALDEIMGQWSEQSAAVRIKYEARIESVGWLRRSLFHTDERLQDKEDDELYSLARNVGEDLREPLINPANMAHWGH
jgi:hypothetical protein